MDYINFKNLKIQKGAAFAPMAGLSDAAGRKIADEFNAVYTVSEMVSIKAIAYGDKKTAKLCTGFEHKQPYGIQLFGSEPEYFAKAVAIIEEKFKPDFIDINMGCPAPKVTNGGNGSALMKNLPLAEECVRQTVDNTTLPVTVKMRLGFDDSNINCVELAKRCEQAGAAAVCVHARTRKQMYQPPIHPEYIQDVVNAVGIPVVANGDILTAQDAQKLIDNTGASLVMVGRGAMGNPWLFSDIFAQFNGQDAPPAPDLQMRMQLMLKLVDLMCQDKGEALAMLQARTITSFFMKGLPFAASLRKQTTSLSCYNDLVNLYNEILNMQEI